MSRVVSRAPYYWALQCEAEDARANAVAADQVAAAILGFGNTPIDDAGLCPVCGEELPGCACESCGWPVYEPDVQAEGTEEADDGRE